VAQRPEPLGAHRGDIVLALQRAFDQKKWLVHQRQPVPVEERGPHDDVDEAGLVLEVQEHEPLGGARALPHHHRARHLHPRAVTEGGQVRRARDAHAPEQAAPERHRMRPEGEAGAFVVGSRRSSAVIARNGDGSRGGVSPS